MELLGLKIGYLFIDYEYDINILLFKLIRNSKDATKEILCRNLIKTR